MRHAEVTLDDKYLLQDGRVFITGVQALIRILLDRPRAGLKTAGFLRTSRWTRPVLEAIAAELDCEPNDLVRRHPSQTSELETFYMSLISRGRPRAIELLRSEFAR